MYFSANIILIVLYFQLTNCEPTVSGRCGKPGLPPKATLVDIPSEQKYFNNKQIVRTDCEDNGHEFPYYGQQRECRAGTWTGIPARCGRYFSIIQKF